MTDYSFNVIIDTSNVQLGQVIRTNISSQGIFRVFYNDIFGNMYCALSRQSNYKQVILETAENRTNLDVSDNLINKTNNPLYGGTNHPEELKYLDNSSNFYVFNYDGNENGVSNNGPWEYFTDLQLQSYIKQGISRDPVSGNTIYDKNGYSTILANGTNSQTPARPYYWYEQQAFGVAVTKSFNKGGHHIGVFVPDLFDLYGQTVKDIENKPLNSNYSVLNNLIDPSGILTQTNMSLDTNPFGKQEIYDKASYVIASKRPKFTWLDENNSARSTGEISTNPLGDTYYKGHFDIFIDISYNSDTSGNVYLVRHNRNAGAEFFDVIYQDLIANGNEGDGVKEVYVDLDLDISKNAIDASFNNIYARPYFAFCSGKYEIVSNERKAIVRYGYAKYDISGANQVVIEELPIILHDRIRTSVTYPDSPSVKYINLKVEPSSNVWSSTRWHIVVQIKEYVRLSSDDGGDDGYNQQLCWISGKGTNMTLDKEVRINSNLSYLSSSATNIINEGKFCSMVVDPSNGYVHIAHYAITLKTTNKPGIIYTYMNPSSGNVEDVTTSSDWEHKLIDDDIGDTLPEDISNNHPIDIKISPFDNSVHICYQKFNSDGTTSIGYWSNSQSVTDLSHVDVSVNYLGVYSQGKTLDISEASVELHWDLPMSNCLFSRDYTRYDGSNNVITGLKEPKQKIKRYVSPRGGRISSITKPHQYNSPLNYKGILCDKIYATCRVKTPSTFNTWNYIFLLGDGAGRFWFGLSNGKLICVKTGITDVSQFKLLSLTGSNYYYKNYSDTSSNEEVSLISDTNYELEMYYNKTNYYGYFIIKNLDDNSAEENGKYSFYNLFQEGGYHIYDGRLTIGLGNHDSIVDEWNGTIYKIAIYATDISNIPTFDISRNEEILTDTSGNKYLNYFDNSGNTGLNIEPYVNRYQIINAVNSLNMGDISGSSYEKPVLLHDIYFLEYIFNQNPITGQKIVGFDLFEGLNEIWAYGYIGDVPTVWVSLDGGIIWDTRETPSTNDEKKHKNKFTCIKTFIDITGGKWVYVGGENYLIYVSNDYGPTENGTIEPGNSVLGINWKIIGDEPCTDGTGDPSGVYFDSYLPITSSAAIQNRTISFIYPVLINPSKSQDIFGTSPSNLNDFHLWIGTKKRVMINGRGEKKGKYDMVLRGNYVDYSNNTLTYKYNTLFNKLKDISNAGLWDFDINYESLLTISFGGVYNGVTEYTNEAIRKGLDYGIIGTENFIFVTKDGGNNWDKRLQIDRKKSFGRGFLLNGYHGVPSTYNNNNYHFFEYYPHVELMNPQWDTYDVSTFCLNKTTVPDWPDTSIKGAYKCLGHDRQPITTTGSYVSKNQTGYNDTNVNMKVFTGTEPWNGNQNFILANNKNNYDLSFSPIDSNTIKTQTWEPSLKTNSFWNVETLDNNGILIPTKHYTFENNYKVYMDKNKLSDNITYKEEEWVIINESLNNKKNILYKKNNEYGYWQKIEYSVVDPLFSQETELIQHDWEGFSIVDLSHSIISIADNNNALENRGFGFFKLSRVPFVPQFNVTYPFGGDVFSAKIDIVYNNESINNFKRLNTLFTNGIIFTKIFIRKQGEDFKPFNQGGTSGLITQVISGLDAGGVFDFKVIFSNKYGESWESTISDQINIPAPSPFLEETKVETKLLVNILTWKEGFELIGTTLTDTVFTYDISKQIIDENGNVSHDMLFNNSFNQLNSLIKNSENKDLHLKEIRWQNDISSVLYDENNSGKIITLLDYNVDLKKTYNYVITVYSKEILGQELKERKYVLTSFMDSGEAENLKLNFIPSDLSLNITWTKFTDISNNLLWDISFTEIRKDGNILTDNIKISDSYQNKLGKGKERKVTLPISPQNINGIDYRFLRADASYNIEISGIYTKGNESVISNKVEETFFNKIDNVSNITTNYNENLDQVNINFTEGLVPNKAYKYIIDFSNNNYDLSFNLEVSSNNFSENGRKFFPGTYTVKIKPVYLVSIGGLDNYELEGLYSENTFLTIPEHKVKSIKIQSFDSLNNENITDVSYIKISWDKITDSYIHTNFSLKTIPSEYELERQEISLNSQNLENSKIVLITDISNTEYIDIREPIGIPTVPRIYEYEIKAKYT